MTHTPVALITGAAQRIGAETARLLHHEGYNIVVHYHHSADDAEKLCAELNAQRNDSALPLSAELSDIASVQALATNTIQHWGRVDALVNNASGFYPTPLASASGDDWDSLFGSNVKGAFFLSQALAPTLSQHQGAIVNIVDIYGDRPLPQHSIYSMAKAALAMMTKSLAIELGPNVRVNGVSPGAILPPMASDEFGELEERNVSERVPLARWGAPANIATTVSFLLNKTSYINGQIIAVDGGRSLSV
ncbi:pteridine reductase [Spongiibacter sp. KMU-166]|uniref:Pteridine reductase n=1 Tax=Spongiibacter thalassae TaxID=2721624 RepID=A0ABX1GIE9_9GAMM|nr:pteridine reductase [Spongiibacter thalassae]NKI18183.1 pteridine reductase [Spongiibacter thalassae]